MAALPPGGVMVAVAASEDEVTPLLTPGVSVAAINGPNAVVIAGDAAAVSRVADQFTERGRRVHRLAVSHAFHSELMAPMTDELARLVIGVSAEQPRTDLVSNVTGQLAGPGYGSPQYWVEHVRQPVRFADGVRLAESLGAGVYLEVGPGAGLNAAVQQSLATDEAASVVTLAKGRPEIDSLFSAAGQLFCTGVRVDWEAALGGAGARRVELPTYGFVRRRFWLGALGSGSGAGVRAAGLVGGDHPLLGAVVERPDTGGVVLTGWLSLTAQDWLADHAVGQAVLFPGAGFVELVLRAGDEVGCGVVDELTLLAPLVLPATGGVRVQVVVDAAEESGSRAVGVYSQAGEPDSLWVLLAQGVLSAGSLAPAADLSVWPPVGASPVDVADAYDRFAGRGYGYGPAFQGLRGMWRREDEIFAEVAIPADAGVALDGFGIHPVVLDAALHAMGMADEHAAMVLPFWWRGVSARRGGVAGPGPDSAAGFRSGFGGTGRCRRATGLVGAVVGDASGIP